MIETLRIEGLAVVERVELEFERGLNVLTGETGAGKSIVLGALALLAGARGSAERVREGSREASVEAVFRTDALPELEAELARRGLEPDGHELVVRRAIAANGRSRAWIAGKLVPVSALAELFSGRIEISSQHESQALLRPETQRRLLDAQGGLLEPRLAVQRGYEALRACDARIATLRADAAERVRRQDFLAYQVHEIDEAKLRPGEIEDLQSARARLAHVERLRGEGAAAVALLAGDPAVSDASSAADLLAEAARHLGALSVLDGSLQELRQRVEAAATEVRDAAADLERYTAGVESDPERLQEVEARLDTIERLRSKYGETVEAILGFRDRAAEELDAIVTADERVAELDRERSARCEALCTAAAALSEGRARAARRLRPQVEAALRALALPQARFEVSLEPLEAPEGLPCGPSGRESVEFLLAANAGDAPRPLRRVASGGELSRVFLALKDALRQESAGMVLVFDEVDAGIGGRIADRVGQVLAHLAEDHQVLCITHLPQIAAAAGTHLRVEKHSRGGRAHGDVVRLDPEARIEEIARMAGGAEISEATRRHARELLRAHAKR
ncbi:MAG: DNA repair protein RecN [Deltaproteobacteria bacterium]|nr:MAG: DNA repair protein RecN [Deltaproteobacteria bacterium]